MQIESTTLHYYTPIKAAKKKVATSNAGEDGETLDHSDISNGNIKWNSHSGK